MNANPLGYEMLKFLFENHQKYLKPERWASLFGIQIVDWDGWKNANTEAAIDLREFLIRVQRSTISPVK